MTPTPFRRAVTTYGLAIVIGLAVIATTIFGALAVYRGDSARKENCAAIEALKTQERAEANERWENLARNLRLLRIESTQEIVTAAREQRDRTLKRFAASSC